MGYRRAPGAMYVSAEVDNEGKQNVHHGDRDTDSSNFVFQDVSLISFFGRVLQEPRFWVIWWLQRP
eukprot:6469686-Pyramimonas_sp.AAC.1